jgi:hypothetical protein
MLYRAACPPKFISQPEPHCNRREPASYPASRAFDLNCTDVERPTSRDAVP